MVDESRQYSAAEMERMMRVQDVLLKAMAKKITWWAAAEIIGVSDRTMRRWRERLEEHGYGGLADRRKGKPSGKRIPVSQVEEVLRLYKEMYYDLNIRHFHEKLREEHRIQLSYTWVQKALQGAGLVAKRHKRGPHRRRRPRRPMPGMLLHIDGSKHRWFNDDRWYDLIVILRAMGPCSTGWWNGTGRRPVRRWPGRCWSAGSGRWRGSSRSCPRTTSGCWQRPAAPNWRAGTSTRRSWPRRKRRAGSFRFFAPG